MSGDLIFEPAGSHETRKHDRMILNFTDGGRLCFNDARKFGRVWLVKDSQVIFRNLGPEPFDPLLTATRFHADLQSKKRQIKPLLLDQSFLAGLGNIYTDEALFLARIHPATTSNRLNFDQASALLTAIREVLNEGIRRNGASIDWVYRGGDFQNYFQVYQRDGEACPRCGTTLERMVIGQRGTHFCPNCQPRKP
jgi:formamidopyrimidine-DNA glycosylase